MGTTEGEMGGGCGMSSGTQRELSEEFAGEIDVNVKVFKRGCQKGFRQDGHDVLCAERAVVSASVD